ncbi:hypothetical protein LX16_2139 [Stackebrandtia albiflava]|uniref:Polyhydroxyalkanoate synthesis regulator phasin n=1 Tax=Stackebrandtia albiflava TaxID=406432 RepID=A0A562VEX7_9ACTN|nr:hypothetical protein [Stackebrandtia albiflava]TWJ16408.1 hypothetical protein LX16_2139 [Stackebrandtia albiflava]
MQDAWRAYLELVLGVTEASRKKAAQVIRSLADQSGAKVEDLQGMAEDLLNAGTANRENLTKLIRFELDRALGKVGLATSEEVADLNDRIRDLEIQLRDARERAAAAEGRPATAAGKTTAKKAAKKTVKKTVKKASAAKKSTAKKSTAKKTTVKKTAKRAPGSSGGAA